MNKIAQIIPYFGEWPEWFNLYLYSCSRNQMIDFIFFTDCPIPKKVYHNTKFISIDSIDYYKLVSNRLGIKYNIKNAYKLTDLKPFLGAIHEPELRGYDFWSFGDIDMVLGDLSNLLSNENLRKYNLITTHNYHIAGHMTVLKNNEYYRNLCFKIPNWETRLSEDKHYGFDEGEWSKLTFPGLFINRLVWKYVVRKFKIIDFFTFMNFANSLNGGKRLFKEFFTSPNPKRGDIWVYDTKKGKVLNPKGKELPYIHFLFFKKTPWFETVNYWKEGYYQLHTDNFEDLHYISISIDGIKKC